MKESVAIAKEAAAKKDFSPTKSDISIHHAQNEPEVQLGSLGGVIGNIRSNGGKPSVESIATQLSSIHSAQRAPVLSALQQTHGNQYVQRVVAGIQAKLKIGQPGDIYEQEADRLADQVMRMPDSGIQRQSNCPECMEEEEIQTKGLAGQITPLVQRQEGEPIRTKSLIEKQEKEEEEEEELQTKASPGKSPEVSDDLQARLDLSKGGGQPLSDENMSFMESRFGTDFSGVRVHTDAEADTLNRALSAHAFSTGQDIFFSQGAYNPNTQNGLKLLAHELTHVVQQRQGLNPSSTPDLTQTIQRWWWRREQQRMIEDVEEDLPREAPPSERRPTYVIAPPITVMDFEEDVETVEGAPLLTDLLNPASGRGWHEYTTFPDNEAWNPRLDLLMRTVRSRRNAATRSREQFDPHARFTRPPGRSGLMYVSSRQAAWEMTQNLSSLGYDSPNYRQRYLWLAFQHVLAGEGDSSSINTYDDQIVTLGHGFSGRRGEVGQILNRLPQSMRNWWLYRGGIHALPNGDLAVFILPPGLRGRPRVLRGELALRRIRTDQPALSLLVEAAQWGYEVRGMEGRQWMLRAQFERFLERNSRMTEARLRAAASHEVVFAAVLMRHWLGGTRVVPLLRGRDANQVITLTKTQHQAPWPARIEARRQHHLQRIREAVRNAQAGLNRL